MGIIASIPEHIVSDQNFLDVAILAEALYNSAAVFMKKKFCGKIDNVFNFCSETDASGIHGQVLFKMMGRMKSLPDPTPKCKNCKQELPSCLNDQVLTQENFVPGAKVNMWIWDGPIVTSVLCHD